MKLIKPGLSENLAIIIGICLTLLTLYVEKEREIFIFRLFSQINFSLKGWRKEIYLIQVTFHIKSDEKVTLDATIIV